jgi:hypothetical protein
MLPTGRALMTTPAAIVMGLPALSTERDKPQLPGPGDLADLRANPAIAEFLAGGDN